MARLASLLLAFVAMVAAACAATPSDETARVAASSLDALASCYYEAARAHRTVCHRCDVPRLDTFDSGTIAHVDFGGAYPVVRYDPERMGRIVALHGHSAAVGIFAHELGHVYSRRVNGPARCPYPATEEQIAACQREELSADAYAGCLLVALGHDVAPFQSWLATTTKGLIHPAGDERGEAVRIGAERCVGWR
jgi:hypothetical protein